MDWWAAFALALLVLVCLALWGLVLWPVLSVLGVL